jgi:hypothetical protein
MGKSKGFTLVLVVVCLLASAILPPITVKADTPLVNGKLTMISPNSNTTYSGTMTLNFAVDLTQNMPIPWLYVTQIAYSIDCEHPIPITIPTSDQGYFTFWTSSDIVHLTANSFVDISNLTNGIHELKIFANGAANVDDDGIFPWNISTDPVFFSVYNFPPPSLFILLPQNQTYYFGNITLGSIPLNFTVNKATSWVGYSLDNQINATVSGNTTLTGLSDGQHSLILFANDTIGNMGASQPMNFTIAVPKTMDSKPFLTATIASVSGIVTVVVAGVGLLIYFKKHKATAHRIIGGLST